jgi:hypothetical protein
MVLVALAGCSDDGGSTVDTGPKPDQAVVPDQTADTAQDLVIDVVDDVGSDQAADAVTEAATPDLGPADVGPPDGPVADAAPVAFTGTISRSVEPILDAKGNVYIGLFILPPPAPIQFGGTVVTGVHLPTPSTKVSYALPAGPGTYWLYAFLDDNSNAVPFPIAMPDAVDIGMSQAVQVKVVAGQPQKLDIVLDKLGGYMPTPDGGMGTLGALTVTVKTSVSPSLDGKGGIWLSLHSQPPPAGLVGQPILHAQADLSSPFLQELCYMGSLQPGKYYLRVFLDDNSNVNTFAVKPDSGDMIHSQPIQVHVTAGTITNHNVVLDKVQ